MSFGDLQELLAVASDQAAHLDDLIGTARTWLYERRIEPTIYR